MPKEIRNPKSKIRNDHSSATDHGQLTTDKSPARPIIPAQHRADLLAALECVDHVLIFDDDTPHALLEQIRPNVLVKGGTTAEIFGREIVESYGGRVVHLGESPDVSTTALIARIQNTPLPPLAIGSNGGRRPTREERGRRR